MANILFRLLREFDLDVRHVPTVARRAGVFEIRYRKPSAKIDVFHGALPLRGSQAHFAMGISSAVGTALLSLRIVHMANPRLLTQFSDAADVWFDEIWTPALK